MAPHDETAREASGRASCPARVFVTGAAGYVGAHVVHALLRDGHAVTALARTRSLGVLAPRIDVVEGDLTRDLDRIVRSLEGHDALVHAALVWGEPQDDLELRDTIATAKLFEAAARAGIRRAVYVSSTAVHRPFRGVMREDDALAPSDVYGATKAAGELFLAAASAGSTMAGVVVRAGPVVGPPAHVSPDGDGPFRSDRRLEQLVEAAYEGAPLDVASLEPRQWIAAPDLADVLVRASLAPSPPRVCAVDRAPIPWTWIAERALHHAGGSSPVVGPPTALPSPTFRTERVEALLGRVLDARAAMNDHLAHLVARRRR